MFRWIRRQQPTPPPAPAAEPTQAAPHVEQPSEQEYDWDIPEELRVPGDVVGTATRYRGALVIDGQTRVCSRCGATEDWLVLLAHATERIYVRCRCGHEWHEPGVTPRWFHTICGPAKGYYPHDQLQAKGFGDRPNTDPQSPSSR
ncbi:hypothetical protein ACFY0R_09940 [Streptomyces sp. NPDC001633]|uniref:hypothetical protein n=1 Tax=Streptomyces sp. NPDC001633 TaxID=3364595 RepID=UPI0036B79705